ncbi:MAG: DMT family transporter [Pseudomonadota bacterium]
MNPVRGILLAMGAVSLFTIMQAFVKAADRIPPGEMVFFRSLFAIPVIVVWLMWRKELSQGFRVKNWRGHAIRGIAGTTAMGLGFAGVRYLPLPDATALRFITPILILVLAAIFLGERIRLIRLSAVIAGLAGVIIILAPQLSLEATPGAAFGAALILGSASAAALSQILIKSMAGKEHTAAIVFWFSLTAAVLSLMTVPFGWVWPTGWEWSMVLAMGLGGGLGQILITSSYRYADAGVIAPFTYVAMLWSIVIGYFFFNEIPTVQVLAGSGLIIAAGAVIVLRERRLGKATTAERKVGAKGL